MRLAIVNHRYAPFSGGSERYMQAVAERALAEGHEVHVFVTDAWDLEYCWDPRRRRIEVAEEVINGVQVHRLPIRHYPVSRLAFPLVRRGMGELSRLPLPGTRRALTQLSRLQPLVPGLAAALDTHGPFDLLHAGNIGLEGLTVAAMRYARARSIPFVLMPFIHLGAEEDARARRYVQMPHQVEVYRAAQAFTVNTQQEVDFLASHGVDPQRVVITGSGVDVDDVRGGDGAAFRTRHGVQGTLIATLGAMAWEKGTPHVVQAVQQLRAAGREVTVALAGPAMSAFSAWLEQQPSRDGVLLLGYIDDAERRDLLAAADMVVLPSRTESFGIVYLEAWVNRLPVLAARAGAVPLLVEHEVNGLLVEYGDVDALAESIARLIDDSALRDRLAVAGEQRALGAYTWEQVTTQAMHAHALALGLAQAAA